jgi:hypothetical protein
MGAQGAQAPPEVEVLIEIPRGSFVKRGSTGHVDFVSPLPCPFNYGSVWSSAWKATCSISGRQRLPLGALATRRLGR